MVGTTGRRRLPCVLVVLVALLVALLPAATVAAAALPTTARCPASSMPDPGHRRGVAPARTIGRCLTGAAELSRSAGPYNDGQPPLLDNGGAVMRAATGSHITVTPIFWSPAGYPFDADYVSVVTRYLHDAAADSGKRTNIFASTTEYAGSNGPVTYRLALGPAVADHTDFPASGCTVDGGGIYPDNAGYTTCLDDTQIQDEIAAVVADGNRPTGLDRMYLMFLPKGVESCLPATPDTALACSINSSPSAAFCGYHSSFGAEVVYANMPFPVYSSPTGYSCGDEQSFPGGIPSPNGNPAADVVISTTSHEMAEAMTDPNLDAWFDSVGLENGDECAYDYGAYSGSAGSFWNQSINGHRYLTQTEFSNAAYGAGRSACIQTSAPPTVTAVSARSGPTSGGQAITITGTGFTGVTGVEIGTSSYAYDVSSDTSISVETPAHGAATVDVRVTGPGGASATRALTRYRYGVASLGSLAPSAGAVSAGHLVTLFGSGFTGATGVRFGSSAARFTVTADSRIVAVTPAHVPSTVTVTVVNRAGTSPVTASTRYLFLAAPRVSGVAPASGSRRGGSTVTISGANFQRVRAVRFGWTAAAFRVLGPTRISVRTPAHAAGAVNVLVYTPGGTSAVTPADRYHFG